MSKIEWTDQTWNPVTGCTVISPGCDNCYAERQAHRMQRMGKPKYAKGFEVVTHPKSLDEPAKWRKPQKVFVNSMSDLFHHEVPYDFIDEVIAVMRLAPQHDYQVLTKRPKTASHWYSSRGYGELPPNLWLGVSVEDRERRYRIDHLKAIPAPVRFLSIEPLLEDVGELDLDGIDWVIVGGESGPGHRRMEPDWARNVRDQCVASGTPFFFKQWGGRTPKAGGRELDGRFWDEFPKRLV